MDTKMISDLNLERDTFITLLSQRKSGKSVLIANLIHYFLTDVENRCHYAYLFSETAKLNQKTNSSYQFFDKRAIFDPSPERITTFFNNLIDSQIKTQMQYHILVVFDDIDLERPIPMLNKMASRGRHFSITIILSAQISNHVVSTTVRNNVDYIFWRRLGKDAMKKDVFDYMSVADGLEFKGFLQSTLDNTSDYQFMCYNNNTEALDGKFSAVKANPLPEGFEYKLANPKPKRTKRRPMIEW